MKLCTPQLGELPVKISHWVLYGLILGLDNLKFSKESISDVCVNITS